MSLHERYKKEMQTVEFFDEYRPTAPADTSEKDSYAVVRTCCDFISRFSNPEFKAKILTKLIKNPKYQELGKKTSFLVESLDSLLDDTLYHLSQGNVDIEFAGVGEEIFVQEAEKGVSSGFGIKVELTDSKTPKKMILVLPADINASMNFDDDEKNMIIGRLVGFSWLVRKYTDNPKSMTFDGSREGWQIMENPRVLIGIAGDAAQAFEELLGSEIWKE